MQPTEKVQEPLTTLLEGVLAGVQRDVPGAMGAAVSAAQTGADRGSGQLQALAMVGIAKAITPITTGRLWGPALIAAAEEDPVFAANIWDDPRWPNLTLANVLDLIPEHYRDTAMQVRGVAAVPGIWDETGVVVLSVYLDHPADKSVLSVLARHERLVTSAVTIASVASSNDQQVEEMLDVLASRAAIEQAKGAIMVLMRCDANEAWTILRRASQQFNIKIRVLATALVEHIGQAPVQQSDDPERRIVVDQSARMTAQLIWEALGMPEAACQPTQTDQTELNLA